MKKWLSVKNAVLTAAALAIVAIGVAYPVEIQRGVGGSVIVGTVDTVEDTILLWQSVDPEEVPLTQLDFGRADISAFGLMKSAGSLPFWVENGGDVAFDLRLEVTDVRVNGVPAGDALRLVFSHAPPPTPTPRPAAVPGRAPTPTLVPPSFDIDEVHSGTDPRVDEPTSTPTPSRRPVPVPSWEHLGTFLPGQVMAFDAGLRFLRTPQQLGISTDDQITFTGLFRAEGPVPTPTPRPPARHELVVALPTFGQESNLPWTLSSFSLVDLRPMFEYLIGVHPESGELVPQLAESWSASPDRTQWTFNLRQRVAFHHGWGQFTSRDVLHSIQMITREESLGSSDKFFWADTLASIQAIDDYTVQFNLNRPEPELHRMVSAFGRLVILSKAQWDAEGDAGLEKQPAGTGPYAYAEREPGASIIYQRVHDHWRRPPDFNTLQLLLIPDAATRLAALRTGQVHMAELPRSIQGEAEAQGLKVHLSQQPAIELAWSMGGQYYSAPEELQPFPWVEDPAVGPGPPAEEARKVRRAINLPIDRNVLNELFFKGRGEHMAVLGFHPSLPGWGGWAAYPYDPPLARQLLTEARYPNGFGFTIYIYDQGVPELQNVGEVMAEMLAEIGLQPTLVAIDFGPALNKMLNKEMHGAMWGLGISSRQPHDMIRIMNYSGGTLHSYEQPEIDALYERLLAGPDPDTRQELQFIMGDSKYQAYAEILLLWLRAEMVANPDFVAGYPFPGNIPGSFTHLEHVSAAR